MGKRGPKPKLAQLAKLEGNPGKRQIIEPSVVAVGVPFIPDHLHDDAQACVELICKSMPKSVYARLDGFILADYGTWWAWHKAAVHEMNSPDFKPIVIGSKGQEQPNPWFKIAALASQRMQTLGDRLGIVISTQSNDPQHPLSEMIDDGLRGDDPTIVCHLYAVPDEQENIFDPACWSLANPALGTFRLREDFEAQAARAKRLRSFENTFRNLYLNQRVSVMTTLFSRSDWTECGGAVEFEDGEEVVLSLDLAGTTDLAALGMMSIKGARFRPYFWKPQDLAAEHGKRDRFPYEIHEKAGKLEFSPGCIINPASIALRIAELRKRYRVAGLVYDRWRIEYLLQELDRADIVAQEGDGAGLKLIPWGQGFTSMAPAIEALENLVLAHELQHPNNPVLTWNIANAVVVTDPAGNRKFDKAKSRLRIDGAQVLAMAAGARAKLLQDNVASVYETRGILRA